MASIKPIWKPIDVDMSGELSGGSVAFSVVVGTETVYTGRAYADGNGDCIVRLNDIFRSYLGKAGLKLTAQTYADTAAVVLFNVIYGDTFDSIAVLNDWSYDPAQSWRTDDGRILSNAVMRDRWAVGTIRPFTIIGAEEYGYAFYDKDGEEVSSGSRTIAGFSETFFARPSVPGRLTLTIEDTDIDFPVSEECGAGSLIYRNTLGGYDTLPIASLVERSTYDRETYDRAGRTASREEHLRREFREAVTRTYTLRTPVLTDAEAARMYEPLGSPEAWLYTPENGYEAVIVKAGEWKRKTFRNEGRKRVVYEFEVEFAQTMERR